MARTIIRRAGSPDRRLLAGGQLPVGRPDLPARQPAAARAARGSSTSSRACSATGARRPGLNFVYAHLNRVIRAARPGRDLRLRPGPRRPGHGRQHLPRGHATASSTPSVTQDAEGHAAAVQAVLLPRRHPQPRRARDARLDPRGRRARLLASRTPTAPPSTTPTCSSPAWSATARPRPGRWRPPGTRTSSSTRSRDGAVLPILHLNGYKIANPTVLARIPRDELEACCAATATGRYFVEGDDPPTMHRLMAATLDAALDEIRRDPAARPARAAARPRPRWPMIVLRTPKGWTGPKEVDGQPTEGTWRSHQVPLAELAAQPRAPARCSRSGCAATGPRSCSTTTGRLAPELRRAGPGRRPPHGRQPARQRRPAAARPAPARLPRLRGRRCRRPAPTTAEATRVLGGFLRDVMTAQRRRSATSGSSRPDELASNRLGAVLEATDRAWIGRAAADRRPPGAGRPGDGDPERAHLPGLAGGLPADRPARPLRDLRGVRPHRRLDVQPARQVARRLRATSPGARPVASLNYLLSSHVWRQDHNGFSHQDPGFIDHGRQQEGRRDPRLPAAGRQHAALGRPTTACAAATTSTSIVAGKQPAPAVPGHGRGGQALHGRDRHLGVGEQRPGRRARRRDGLRRRRARRSRRWRRSTCCASDLPGPARSASSTSST